MAIPTQRMKSLTFPPPPANAEADTPEGAAEARLHLNEAALGPSPAALKAAAAALAHAHRYPDHEAVRLAARLAELTGIPANRISFGNGSGEILVALALMSTEPGLEAIFPTPTFPTCPKGVQISGGTAINVPVTPDGMNDVPAMLARITDKTRLFYICTPNNPTGHVVPAADIARAAAEVPENCLLVVDEAYFEFAQAEGGPDVLQILKGRKGPWVVTRSFSKAYCLAGLRAGYALCSDEAIRDGLWSLRPNFNLNRAAQAAALAALDDQAHLERILTETIRERHRLAGALEARGYAILPSFANFLTVRPPETGPDAAALAGAAQARDVWIQAMAWPDKRGALRITIGTAADSDRLLAAL